jgi:DNA gyrase subunit B
MTTLHAGGKFNESGGTYEASGGLHGVGASCVNALSDSLTAEVFREGYLWRQTYSAGKPTSKVSKISECKKGKTGTKITWHADPSVFKNNPKIDDNWIVRRIREMAFLNRGLKLNYVNQATNFKETFYYTGGIADYTKFLCQGKAGLYPTDVIYGEGKVDLTSRSGQCGVQIALVYSEEDDESILSFVNNIITSDGGTHVSGFKTALTRVINNFARQHKLIKDNGTNLNGDDVREGLIAIISIRFPRPEFVSQTKSKLGSVEVETVVSNLTINLLTSYFDKNAGVLKKIVERALLAQEARTAAKKTSELIKRKGILGKNNRMPGKLYDCNTEKKELSELFIVEGDSAAGSAKDGRDPEIQAILPVRGKVINAEKNDVSDLLNNKEIVSLIIAIGTGIKDDFNLDKLRYNKVIIMADADVDGCHIATLLLTFFYRYMRPLVAGGHVYLAQPPLFCVEVGKVKKYCWTNEEMQAETKKHAKSKVVRFKGLGEMDAEQLAETTMQPDVRRLIQLQINDPGNSEHIVSVLMGTDAAPRKKHIINQVNSVIKQ